MVKTFSGGLHMPDCKNTRDLPITKITPPDKVSISLQQHIGAPATILVKKGDYVKKGQLIGTFENGLSCNIHASVSGTVTEIVSKISTTGLGTTSFVEIENDHTDTFSEDIKPYDGDPFSASPDEIIELVKKAGVCGLGGAAFPTYAKIQSAIGKAEEIIINCAECEPYITENYRLMLERADKIIRGARILMHATGTKHMTFAVENNKKDAASIIEEKTLEYDNINVQLLKTKYPQGDERHLMYVLKKVQLPAGKLPADVGCVVFNVETCIAVYNAVFENMPLIHTVFTVDGDAVNEPKNIVAPVGTSIADVIEFCGGAKDNLVKIVNGGPMMGQAQWDINATIAKNTSAILCFSDETQDNAETDCIHCGKCVSVCPMHLMPNYLAAATRIGRKDMAEEFNVLSCVECGSCTYICPANVPIVQYIRKTKGAVLEEKKRAAAKSKESEAKSK